MGFKPSTPGAYGGAPTFKTSPDTVNAARSGVGGKAKARYVAKPKGVNATEGGGGGKMKHAAYTSDNTDMSSGG